MLQGITRTGVFLMQKLIDGTKESVIGRFPMAARVCTQ